MGLNPQQVRTVKFKTVKKGLDPEDVQSFLASVADDLERAQNQAAAMEARARAAVQRVQELTPDHTSKTPPAQSTDEISASVDETETISRTLLLAQRTADTTIADAEAEVEALLEKATEDSARELDAARGLATQMAESARSTARQIGESERAAARDELRELQESRAGLSQDVAALEQFLEMQRERLRDAARTLVDLTERIPGGLGTAPAPVPETPVDDETSDEGDDDVSTAATPDTDATDADTADDDTADDDTADLVIVADLADESSETEPSLSAGDPGDADATAVMEATGDPTPMGAEIWPPEDASAPPTEADLHFNFSDDR